MADPEHLAILGKGVKAWNEWRQDNPEVVPDLRNADLAAANLLEANLSKAWLNWAQLSRADLRGANLAESYLFEANLREADLQGADLSTIKVGLLPQQLAGSNLTGATLPEPLGKLFEGLNAVGDISESARKLFVAMLAACLYCWLTIATTTDVNLITNRASSPLPIIQTSIPIVGFYVVAPLLLLCVYFYFHFYLQKLWEELGSLPAIFPDGRPLHARSDPWLLNDLVRSHLAKLRADRPFMSYFQQAISTVLAWWLVPITLLLFWGRYLPRHDFYITTLQVTLLALSITAAVLLYRLAAGTLRGVDRASFSWKGALKSLRGYGALAVFFATGTVFMFLSVRMINNSAVANLAAADLSVKPPNWTGKNDSELDLVKGVNLMAADLRYAHAAGAFLAKATLIGARLQGAFLTSSDLRRADLTDANLTGAYLTEADLTRAEVAFAALNRAHLNKAHLTGADLTGARLADSDLTGADLTGARLTGADLTGAHLSGADLAFGDFRTSQPYLITKGLTADTLKTAKNWDKAYYDDDLLQKLGLSLDHNEQVADEQKLDQPEKQGTLADGRIGASASHKPQRAPGGPAGPK